MSPDSVGGGPSCDRSGIPADQEHHHGQRVDRSLDEAAMLAEVSGTFVLSMDQHQPTHGIGGAARLALSPLAAAMAHRCRCSNTDEPSLRLVC